MKDKMKDKMEYKKIQIWSWHSCYRDDEILEKAGLSYRHALVLTGDKAYAAAIAAEIFINSELNVMLIERNESIVVAITVGGFGQRG